ncbi:coiled-coil domain-containing protein [Helicobacter pullorum]
MVNGLQKGIREGIAKLNEGKDEKEQLEFYNFGLGGTNSIQSLYEIIKHKDLAKNAELIITESNINEMHHHFHLYQKLPYQHIYRYLNWFYKELYFLKTKILVVILPYPHDDYKTITNIHKKLCVEYGFNFLDMQEYYEKYNCVEFGKRIDAHHQQARIMCEMGKNIIGDVDDYHLPKSLKIKNDNPKFAICTPKDMELVSGELQEIPMKNSAFNEVTYRIKKDTKLKFPDKFIGFQPIGIHAWNNNFEWNENFEIPRNWMESICTYSSLLLSNKTQSFSKESALLNQAVEIQKMDFKIDNSSFITLNCEFPYSEFHIDVRPWLPDSKKLNFFDLIAFLLAKGGNFYTEEIDFESLANENIEIEEKYNFNHLIPDIKLYKEIIDEYCAKMDPIKLTPLQKQLTQKASELQSKNQALDLKSQELESLKSQYDSKIKELQVNLKTAQDTLSSLPTKKQTLEIKNLESDLKIKELKAKQIEKELGYSYNVLEELDLKKQELIKVKQQLDSTKKQLDSTKKQLESKNTGLESNLNYPIFKGNLSYLNTMTTAKDRIHNHLSYKLGKAMIENSKSILGYIRMPYVLSYIKEQHHKEQKQYQEQIKKNPNLKLPKLESYKDYKEALKEKECFTYKLGEALMKADKTWYKGGYVKLWFEAKRLEREYREKRGG